MADPILLIDDADPAIVILTLNRPEKRNALSVELIEKITAAITSASADGRRRVLILTANGPAFCAGLDLKEASSAAGAERSAAALSRMYLAIGNSPLITIAAAAGAAMGGGAGMLAACDFVVAADDVKIAYPEVHRGLVAALVTCLLRRRLTDAAVRQLILLGENVTGQSAREMGLVNSVVPNARLTDETMQLARDACAGAPGAIARSKRLLDELSARTLEEELRIALRYHMTARNSAEAAEGMAAFVEKRPPKWGPRDV
ncbi:MAG TPA: enoyl-CoA hydratase/isomerase family protein [Tepidisphaeraceae bacterium]|jgi:methylglutaconyl-CoA hydratase|nr:enoyl-CoA hydratase/isomerase family protein [Tepidisphaeraceae bacterium]